jgi:hypothetical protein
MKYTDGLFNSPIRIYDGFSIRKALRDEEHLELPQEVEWVLGYAEIPLQEIYAMHDFFQSGRSVKEVAEEGFEGTLVMTKGLGDFICTWKRDKFKEKLNAFADKYNQVLESHVESLIAEKEQEYLDSLRNKPPSWWQFWKK